MTLPMLGSEPVRDRTHGASTLILPDGSLVCWPDDDIPLAVALWREVWAAWHPESEVVR